MAIKAVAPHRHRLDKQLTFNAAEVINLGVMASGSQLTREPSANPERP